jgi:hypothetical protein
MLSDYNLFKNVKKVGVSLIVLLKVDNSVFDIS